MYFFKPWFINEESQPFWSSLKETDTTVLFQLRVIINARVEHDMSKVQPDATRPGKACAFTREIIKK